METRPRILVVEDHTDTVRLLEKLLTLSGYPVVTAQSCAQALAASRARVAAGEVPPFDLYLLDVGLPDGDGCNLLRELRGEAFVPAVALTGYGMAEDITRAKEAGFNEVLVKPIVLSALRSVIERLCKEDNGEDNGEDKRDIAK